MTPRMMLSGLLGLTFFLVANFTQLFYGLDIVAGCIQITLNIFVFLTWKEGVLLNKGFKKFVALIGTVVPIIMASITIIRVLLPALLYS